MVPTEQWQQEMSYAEDLSEMKEQNPNFVDSIITGDESCCFTYDPLTKQSVTWVGLKSPYLKELHFQKLKIKTWLILFFYSKGVVHKEFVLESQKVIKEFYVEVLGCLLKQIAHVRLEEWKNRSFNLLHDYVLM